MTAFSDALLSTMFEEPHDGHLSSTVTRIKLKLKLFVPIVDKKGKPDEQLYMFSIPNLLVIFARWFFIISTLH